MIWIGLHFFKFKKSNWTSVAKVSLLAFISLTYVCKYIIPSGQELTFLRDNRLSRSIPKCTNFLEKYLSVDGQIVFYLNYKSEKKWVEEMIHVKKKWGHLQASMRATCNHHQVNATATSVICFLTASSTCTYVLNAWHAMILWHVFCAQ